MKKRRKVVNNALDLNLLYCFTVEIAWFTQCLVVNLVFNFVILFGLQGGFISVTDFWHNPLRIFAAHEISAVIDPAMATKMTVSI